MTDEPAKTSLQASGEGHPKPSSSDTGLKPSTGAGESQGGAYPNPHTGKEEAGKSEGFHGGQSKTAYHGTGQLGDEDIKGQKNVNSPAKHG